MFTMFQKGKRHPPLLRDYPPVAGAITWERQLYHRLKKPVLIFQKVEEFQKSELKDSVSLFCSLLFTIPVLNLLSWEDASIRGRRDQGVYQLREENWCMSSSRSRTLPITAQSVNRRLQPFTSTKTSNFVLFTVVIFFVKLINTFLFTSKACQLCIYDVWNIYIVYKFKTTILVMSVFIFRKYKVWIFLLEKGTPIYGHANSVFSRFPAGANVLF